MKHVKEIIFFEDYGLWAKCGKAARVNKVSLAHYITECVEKTIGIEIGYDEELYDYCDGEAQKQGISIAGFIENCCKEVIGEKNTANRAEKKLGFFELPKG